ncbi:hypothetical protein, partial [Corallococcus terminator]
MRQLHYEFANPNRARAGLRPPPIIVLQNLWDDGTIAKEGAHLREYTEGEQLFLEDIEESKGYWRQERCYRRACTLRVLPESGTDTGMGDNLLYLQATRPNGSSLFPYW